MPSGSLICIVFGLVFAALAAFITPTAGDGVSLWRRIHFGWAAVFCLFLSMLLGGK